MNAKVQTLEIPEDEQKMFESLARAPEAIFDALDAALAKATPTLNHDGLLDRLREDNVLANYPELDGCVSSLISMVGTAYSVRVSTEKIIDIILETLNEEQVIKLSEDESKCLRSRLLQLQKNQVLEIIAKASILMCFSEHRFQSAKIVSDIRPICLNDEMKIGGTVLVHQLSIRTKENGQRKSTYFTLNSSDLHELSAVITRAVKKDFAMREYVKSLGTPMVNPPVDDMSEDRGCGRHGA
jgi:hypothetical protein